MSRTTSYGFLAPCQNLEKVNSTIQTKRQDRLRTEGRTDPILLDPSGYCRGSKIIQNIQVVKKKLNLKKQ